MGLVIGISIRVQQWIGISRVLVTFRTDKAKGSDGNH
jgi:hypothetical protein